MHSTNYTNTFIEVADDCRTGIAIVPPEKNEKTVARLQFEMIRANPYAYTSDDVIFSIYVEKNGIRPDEIEARRNDFFSKGQPCLRSSPLGKTYGWGFHFNGESKVALYPRESEEYSRLRNDRSLRHLKAMKSSR